ncbi:hypothetical protein BV898_01875 [Hypsibius exemplaris]|uniref:Integrase zinc-binding domain-containing protein n=1 Tax=Hypsibius exemplaris TaxID=2072580 RepID=A0A1W0X9Y2_HYPEX|nr:hypothetical protein BV898_01875 [Hypsibius exemplaris]
MEDDGANFSGSTGEIFPTLEANGTATGEVLAEVSDSPFAAAPTCLVLTDDVQKIFLKGSDLIVGTSMSDIQTFFQKVIAEAQLGMEQTATKTVMMDFSRRPTGNARSSGLPSASTNASKPDRYPIPFTPLRKTKAAAARLKKSYNEVEPEVTQEPATEVDMERSEIPLDAIKVYLSEKKYFPGWNPNSKRNLRKRCDDFVLEHGQLFYRTKKGKKVHCVEDRAERVRLIWQQHSIDHRRRDRLFSTLRDKYYWKGMLNDVNRVLESCEYCARIRDDKGPREREPEEIELAKLKYQQRMARQAEQSAKPKRPKKSTPAEVLEISVANHPGTEEEPTASQLAKQLTFSWEKA